MAKTKSTVKYITGSFVWGGISKLLDAGIKFLTIPLLLTYYGKENYGLLTLAIATNTYMHLLDMGMNTGGIKFFSQWLASGKYDLINRAARTNITFYLAIGLLNSTLLIAIAMWGEGLFKVTQEQFSTFRHLLFLLAAFSIVNWLTFVFSQLLIANEKMAFTQQMLTVRSILGLMGVVATIFLKWTLVQYFFVYLLISASIILPYYFSCRRQNLIKSIIPAFFWHDFAVVFKYGLAILAMSIFQFTATHSRPLILGMFSNDGVGILSEYRIIEVFPIFIISLGGMLIPILLPKTSKAIQNGDRKSIEKIAYKGTRYTSILVSVLCFPVMLCAQELLTLYVGTGYAHLAVWLMLWLFTLTLFLHNTPVASLVLATGKTRMLVYSSAIACVLSIIINALLTNKYGVGSAVIGYIVYIIIQVSFYYLYFNNRVLGLKSMRVFKSFIIPTSLGFIVFLIVQFMGIEADLIIFQLLLKTVIWVGAYLLLLGFFRVLDIKGLSVVFRNNRRVK